jgi:hypothetical protein
MLSIRAELSGSTICAAAGQIAISHTPILLLCRQLIAAGCDPATPLEAWRGPTLCLRIGSLGAGARLTIDEHGDGIKFARWKPFCRVAGSPRIAQNLGTVS